MGKGPAPESEEPWKTRVGSKDGGRSKRSASESKTAERAAGRKTSCVGTDANGRGMEPHPCPPAIYRIQGSTSLGNSMRSGS
jgi:hypothetical protein